MCEQQPMFEHAAHPAVAILHDLIALQSVNPVYAADARGEAEVADYVEQRARRAGLQVRRQQVLPGRSNVVVELRVGRPEQTLLFEAHMDTVSLGSMVDPLRPTVRGDRLYGRGACDTKGSLAGMLWAIEQAALEPEALNGDIVLCASVDEEHAYRGVLAFLDLGMPIAGAVVGEPTDLNIVIAHKGCARFAVTTHGRAAHSSVPREGHNAIYDMADVLSVIREQIEPKLAGQHHPLCGPPTLVVSMITGGQQVNIVPERCRIEIDRRVIGGEDPEAVIAAFERDLRRYLGDRAIEFTVERTLVDWPLDTASDARIVTTARQVAAQLSLSTSLHGVPYGSDASKLQQFGGIPSIVFGPGSIAQAHAAAEWVSIRQVEQAAEFYAMLARTWGHEDERVELSER